MEKQVANMSHCKMLILDEADKLLSQDFKRLPRPRRPWWSREPASLWWWCPG